MKVILSGASGFVGSRLKPMLAAAGHAVTTVGRGPASDVDWSERALAQAMSGCDAIVHLAGENLFARRWSAEQKRRLVDSRVDTTRLLAKLAATHGVRTFISASAVGWYGAQDDAELDETAPRGSGFLADLCRDWEQATEAAAEAGVRTARVRTGVVLGLGGGALSTMLPPFRLGVGGPLGRGRQWVSWIHLDDLCRIYVHLVEHARASGAFNATAPKPVTMRELARTLARVLHRPALFTVPAPVLRLALGEVADVLLTGQRVLPRRTLATGFEFEHPELEGALESLLTAPARAFSAPSAR